MFATEENYIVPLDRFLVRPAGHASMYEYLLACQSRIAETIGDYTAFVTPAGETYS